MNAPQLITRCAHCQTVFRITATQLQARGGRVRCGRCLQVFDALAGLQADAAQADSVQPLASAPAAAQPFPSQPDPAPTQTATEVAATAVPAQAPLQPEDTAFAAEPAAKADDTLSAIERNETVTDPGQAQSQARTTDEASEVQGPLPADASDAPDRPPVAMTATAAITVSEPLIDEDNPFVPQAPVVEPHRRAWAVASALLLLLGLGQAAYFYRGEIAARHALAREWVMAACAAAGCNVEMPQRPKSVLIEGSDLQVIDPARPERIQLTATLRNHAGHAVGYPALDLVLTNANDHTLARRIFVPAEYLPAGVDRAAGLAANAEMTVRLALDAGSLGASGFRLAVLAAMP